jgi:putative transposase
LVEVAAPLSQAEPIDRHGLWRSVEEVELATADWVHFWNARRLHSACGDVPPAEFEATYHQRLEAATEAA